MGLKLATVKILADIPCFKCLFWEPIRQCDVNECQKLMDWLLIQAEECRRTEEALVDINTCLRRRIQELLRQHPWTANGLSKSLRRDKAHIRRLLLVMERQGLVTWEVKRRGGVTYKFWRLLER